MKKKLGLHELKVESFITSIVKDKTNTLKGGTGGTMVTENGPGTQIPKNINSAEAIFYSIFMLADKKGNRQKTKEEESPSTDQENCECEQEGSYDGCTIVECTLQLCY